MEFMHGLTAQLTPAALVGFAGVTEAVAQHPLSTLQRGENLLIDILGAVGKHEGQLCHGREARGARIQQDRPQAVSQSSPARLACDDDIYALAAQVSRELLQLGRFAGAVEALKGNEL